MDYFLREYIELPPFTKYFATACILLSMAVNLEFLTIYDIYFNPSLIIGRYEIWRLITPFLYIGPFDLNFLLSVFFSFRYCKYMETSTYHSRQLDFGVFFIYGWITVLLCGYFTSTMYLNDTFIFMMIYVWARINPTTLVNVFGIIMPANVLPLLILFLTFMFSSTWHIEAIGFATGHIYYYFEFILPNIAGGFKLFQPWIWGPKLMDRIFHRRRNIANENNNSNSNRDKNCQTEMLELTQGEQLKSEEFKENNSTIQEDANTSSNNTTTLTSENEETEENLFNDISDIGYYSPDDNSE